MPMVSPVFSRNLVAARENTRSMSSRDVWGARGSTRTATSKVAASVAGGVGGEGEGTGEVGVFEVVAVPEEPPQAQASAAASPIARRPMRQLICRGITRPGRVYHVPLCRTAGARV